MLIVIRNLFPPLLRLLLKALTTILVYKLTKIMPTKYRDKGIYHRILTLLACPISDMADDADSCAWPMPDVYVATPLVALPLFASPTAINKQTEIRLKI